MAAGSWALAQELFARGDPAFAAELRLVHAPEPLAGFAAKWLADPRPVARALLLDYLAGPLNAYRHEPLVKRLFKLAQKAGDDEAVGALAVAFDRAVRRKRRTATRGRHRILTTRAEAEAAVRAWEAEGFGSARVHGGSGQWWAYASKVEERVLTPGNTAMPRPVESRQKRAEQLSDYERQRFERKFTLFSPPTRRYLRRRAWRHFRLLGKADPARYVDAAAKFLARYADADVDSDIHLLDNWCLVHALFRDCPALERPAIGWRFAEGKALADLAFAPYRLDAWAARPEPAFDLLLAAQARTVRLFAAWVLRTHHADWLSGQPVPTLLRLADHPDADVSALGFELLEAAPDLSGVPVAEWLARLDGDDLDRLARLSNLLERRLDPGRVTADDAIRLASHRSRPVAALGLVLLRGRTFAEADVPVLLPLAQAECAAVRPGLVAWLRGVLGGFGPARPEWLLDFLDSKHADVRAEGVAWLAETPMADDASLWAKLLESPYDDMRIAVTDRLSEIAATAEPGTLRLLWATTLLNLRGAGRRKPGAVAQVVARLRANPGEADQLLPILAAAVRSLRGPEFRAGLTGIVAILETCPELRESVGRQFPELLV